MKPVLKSMIALTLMIFCVYSIANAQDSVNGKTAVIKIKTSAICSSCKDRIEKNLIFVKGITDAVLDVDTKIVTVTYKADKTNPDKIRLAISKIGYDADTVPADPKAYAKLPACCKKDATPHH